jgi:Concanavalin A-like lectin/glucanases superfamily
MAGQSMDNQDSNFHRSDDMTNDVQERIGLLLSRMLDESISADDQHELVEILESSEAAKKYFLGYLQTHSDLSNQWGGDRVNIATEMDLSGITAWSHPVDTGDQRHTWSRALVWLAVGIAASTLFFALFVNNPVESDPAQSPDSITQNAGPKDVVPLIVDSKSNLWPSIAEEAAIPEYSESERDPGWSDVAVVVRNEGVADPSLQIGQRLAPGLIHFDSGTLQLQFMSGASMVLSGPAELQIVSAKSATLNSGTAKTRANYRAKGFVLNTADAAVVDIGTEFGISFDPLGQPEVEVIDGEIEFSLLGQDGATLVSRRMGASEVVAVQRDADPGYRLPNKASDKLDQLKFELPEAPSPGQYPQYSPAVLESKPLVYWRFEAEPNGKIENAMSDRWDAEVNLSNKEADIQSAYVDPEGFLRLNRSRYPRCVTSLEPLHGLDKNDFSVEFWMNPNDLEHSQCLGLAPFEMKDRTFFLSVVEVVSDTFMIHQPGSLRMLMRNPPESKYELGKNVFSPGKVTPGQWHHVVMVAQEDKLSMFLNGDLIQSVELEANTQPASTEGFRIILGQLSTVSPERQFSGMLDEFALYDRVLSALEISRHHQIGMGE